MACRDVYRIQNQAMAIRPQIPPQETPPPPAETVAKAASEAVAESAPVHRRLYFGVDSKTEATDILQNNLTLFQWAVRNKIYPAFWGRNISGDNKLTKEEMEFFRQMACNIAAIYATSEEKSTEEQGAAHAQQAALAASELEIPKGKAIFLEMEENTEVTTDYLRGFARQLVAQEYTPGFKVNTDAAFPFDREYSRGLQTDNDLFRQCLVWATSPILKEYDKITNSHLIHPDNWKPFAPSGIIRDEIAIWQYGKNCHPIHDDNGQETLFHLDLVKNETIITQKMF